MALPEGRSRLYTSAAPHSIPESRGWLLGRPRAARLREEAAEERADAGDERVAGAVLPYLHKPIPLEQKLDTLYYRSDLNKTG